MSKTSLWLTVIALGWAAPTAPAATELESLRQKVAEQEQQIRRLEQENLKLRGEKPVPPPSTATAPADESPDESPAEPSPEPAVETTNDVPTPATEKPAQDVSGPPLPSDRTTSKPADETDTEVPAKATPVDEDPPETTGEVYTVVARDSFDKIARKKGCSAEALAKANGLKLTSIIHPGLKLKIPAKSAAPATPARKKPGTPADGSAADPATKDPATKTPPSDTSTKTGKKPAPADTGAATTSKTDKSGGSDKTRAVKIEAEMTYGEFAAKYETSIERLNDLNGLDLQKDTVLATGSELYVPGRP